jgi:hypothetical protein
LLLRPSQSPRKRVALILLIPKELIATADGEPNTSVEAETLQEIEATS